MTNYQNQLELIQLVNNNYSHISQLEAVGTLLENLEPNVWLTAEQIDKLRIICKTTYNSHYNYRVYLNDEYKNPNNHVDNQLTIN